MQEFFETRAAIYGRYSSDRQAAHSAQDQLSLGCDYAARMGFQVVATYADEGLSGRMIRKRDGFQDLLRDAKRGNFDVMIVEAVDRIARSARHAGGFLDIIDYADIEIHGLAGRIDRLLFQMQSVLAEHQSRESATRTRQRQIARQTATGRVVAGFAYGYDALEGAPDEANRAVNPEQAAIVCRIYEEFANGISPARIAARLNADGIPGPRGLWNGTTIRGHGRRETGILRNRIYVGEVAYGRTVFRINPETDTRVSRPAGSADRIVRTAAPHLRIIDDALWERVQMRLESTGHRIATTESGQPLNVAHRKRFLLSGLLVCGCCGGSYAIMAKDRYGCSTRKNKGTCDNAQTITRMAIETRVLAGIKRGLMQPDLVERFVARVMADWKARRQAAAKDERSLRRRLADVERKISRIVDQIEDGLGDPRTLGTRLRERETEKAEIVKELTVLDAPDAAAEPMPNFGQAYAGLVRDLEEMLRDETLVQRAHETLASLIAKVVLIPDPDARDGMRVELHGELARIMALCAGARDGPLATAIAASGSQVSVVAGAGFEPATFRL